MALLLLWCSPLLVVGGSRFSASDLALKRGVRYGHVLAWMRCSLSYCLARAAIRCIRGSRGIKRPKSNNFGDG